MVEGQEEDEGVNRVGGCMADTIGWREGQGRGCWGYIICSKVVCATEES